MPTIEKHNLEENKNREWKLITRIQCIKKFSLILITDE